MSTGWKGDWLSSVAAVRICDGCGARRAMLTRDDLPMAWVRKSPVPPGWTRFAGDTSTSHYCRACSEVLGTKRKRPAKP